MTNGVATTIARGPGPGMPMTPARLLTLVLGVPVLIALIGLTGFSAADQLGSASFPVRYTFPAAGNGQVTAQIEGGNITLRQAAAATAELTGIAHYTLFRSTITTSGDSVRYRCANPLGSCELDGTLHVPAASPVSLSTGGGDVSVPSFDRGLTLDTGGGNLTAGSLTGGVNLVTSGGDANVARLTGPPATLVTGGGNVTVEAMATSATAKVQSDGGDVSLTYTKAPADLRIASGGGNVTVVLPHGEYGISANAAGGNISTPPSHPSARSQIIVQSSGGDITITEAS